MIDLHVSTYGSGSKDILLIHGWAGSYLAWKAVIEQAGFPARWWSLDLPGHGLSPTPDEPATIDYHLRAVHRLIEAQAIKPSVIIAHSTGGMIALKLLHQYPHIARKLVLVSPVITGKFGIGGLGSRFLQTPIGQSVWCKTYRAWPLVQNRSMLHALLTPLSLDPQGKRSVLDDFTAMDASCAIETLISLAQETTEGILGEIQHPTLIAVGAKDKLVPPDEGKKAVEAMPHAQLVTFPKAYHRPMDTETGQFIRILTRFLEEDS